MPTSETIHGPSELTVSAALLDNSLETSIRLGAAAARLRIELAPAHTRAMTQAARREAATENLVQEFYQSLRRAAAELADAPDADPLLTERVLSDEIEAYRHWLKDLVTLSDDARPNRAA